VLRGLWGGGSLSSVAATLYLTQGRYGARPLCLHQPLPRHISIISACTSPNETLHRTALSVGVS
jgi:hypothetical protein